ncbi:uncharacterized protein Triagg1_9590 [Trichoderma aggressivum f. europaeum]|uniref:Uncharacterized protein n=1 Tax=Trichoderma aggressivum f. europaeum TaxID=173218 RepID=A0AAE1I6C7_9HYPO|nr:hypothetical protein Triagg1_9590 [Trichoderma aggressivum f. europaeum]
MPATAPARRRAVRAAESGRANIPTTPCPSKQAPSNAHDVDAARTYQRHSLRARGDALPHHQRDATGRAPHTGVSLRAKQKPPQPAKPPQLESPGLAASPPDGASHGAGCADWIESAIEPSSWKATAH